MHNFKGGGGGRVVGRWVGRGSKLATPNTKKMVRAKSLSAQTLHVSKQQRPTPFYTFNTVYLHTTKTTTTQLIKRVALC